jgi:hypothetical protein
MRVLLLLISGWCACVYTRVYVCLITVNPEPLPYAIHFDDLHALSVLTAIIALLNIQLTDTAEGFILISGNTNIYCLQYSRACWCRCNVVHARTIPFSGIQFSKASLGTRLRLDDSGCESLLQKTLTQPDFYWVEGLFPGVKPPGREVNY